MKKYLGLIWSHLVGFGYIELKFHAAVGLILGDSSVIKVIKIQMFRSKVKVSSCYIEGFDFKVLIKYSVSG